MITKINPGKARQCITFMDNITYAKSYSPLKDSQIELKLSIMAKYGNSEMRAATGMALAGAKDSAAVKKPLIIWIPGGGFRGVPGSDKNLMVSEMQFLAEAGYIVVSIYYRSSAEAHFPAQIIDVKSAIRFLRANSEKFSIDPEKIGVTGRSAGGHLAAHACMNLKGYDEGDYLDFTSDVQCGVDYFGPVDFFEGFAAERERIKNPGHRWKSLEETHEGAVIGGSDETKPELTREASPVYWVNEKSSPILILHGESDPLVSCNQSVTLHNKMKAAGRECDLFILEGAGHGTDDFWQESTKKLVCDFFDKHLKQ